MNRRPNRRQFVQGVGAAGLALVAGCGIAGPRAQAPAQVPRVDYLTGSYLAAIPHRIEAFRQGLHELGYVEGNNIAIEWRAGEGLRHG
jgi:putative ABC transport system substrate-binding protein